MGSGRHFVATGKQYIIANERRERAALASLRDEKQSET